MIKVTPLDEAEHRPRSIAIGTFDGVHIGHREVIDGADTVLTFEPHPLEVLHPAAAPKLLMPFDVKRDVLEGIGVREVVVIGFDEKFTKITAEQFIEEILIDRLGAKSVAVGENFRFGTDARPAQRVRHTGGSNSSPGRGSRFLITDTRAGRQRENGRGEGLPRRPLHGRRDCG
jgi:FAD synthase